MKSMTGNHSSPLPLAKRGEEAAQTKARSTLSVLFIAVMVLAVFLRLYDLGTESYWHDEITMVKVTTNDFQTVVDEIEGGRPPLYVILSYGWSLIFGDSEAGTRGLSAIVSIGAVAALYFAARELFNNQVALISALLMAISGFQIHHAQDHRYYALLVMVATLSFLFYIRALRGGKWQDFILWIVFGLATFYTHTNGAFVLLAQGIFYVLQWFRYKAIFVRWFLSVVAISIGALPGLYLIFESLIMTSEDSATGTFGPTSWISTPTLISPIRTIVRFFFYDLYWFRVIPLAVGAIFLVLAVLYFVRATGFRQWFASLKGVGGDASQVFKNANGELLMVLCWMVVPILTPLLLSWTLAPMYLDRYMIAASGGYYIMLAVVLVTLHRVVPVYASLGALLIVMLAGLYTFYVDDYKEQWREIGAYVAANEEAGDVIVVSHSSTGAFPSVRDIFLWYYDGEQPVCSLIEDRLDDPAHIAEINDCIAGAERLWIPAILVEFDDSTDERVEEIEVFFRNSTDTSWNIVSQELFVRTRVLVAEPRTETSMHGVFDVLITGALAH